MTDSVEIILSPSHDRTCAK